MSNTKRHLLNILYSLIGIVCGISGGMLLLSYFPTELLGGIAIVSAVWLAIRLIKRLIFGD